MAPFNYFILYIVLMAINVVTLNTQGLRLSQRRAVAFNFLKKYDIILLQETHWTDDINTETERDWGGQIIRSNGSDAARGVAILINKRLNATITNTKSDNEGRIVNAQLKLNDIDVTVTNIYAPNKDTERRTFFQHVNYYSGPSEGSPS